MQKSENMHLPLERSYKNWLIRVVGEIILIIFYQLSIKHFSLHTKSAFVQRRLLPLVSYQGKEFFPNINS